MPFWNAKKRRVQKPAATFFVRAQGESMIGVGIHPNDILVVDRSIEPVPGKIVICALNGELTVKRLDRYNGQWQLKAGVYSGLI